MKVMNYITLYNLVHPNNEKMCACIENINEKYVVGQESASIRKSHPHWVSHLCRNSLGGSTQFGNGYINGSININYLGRVEGQPGGSGAPPRNRF
jgi:hypothetical protein